MVSRRHLVAAGFSLGVTFGLFYVMQALISMSGAGLDESARGFIVEFIRLRKDSRVETKKREIPDKELPPKPPPIPDLDLSDSSRLGQDLGAMVVGVGVDLDLGAGPDLGAAATDGDVIPIVRVNPQYPIRAAEQGIEGWVELMFTISVTGAVLDPVVTASHPGRIFDRAAIRAVSRWKYNPKIEDGEAMERPGVTVRLRFQLEND
jgi:protein TonB